MFPEHKNDLSSNVIQTLLKAGADIEARDNSGRTPLMWMVSLNCTPKVIEVLLKAGADIEVKDNDGQNALMWARFHRNSKIIAPLLEADSDIETNKDDGLVGP